MRRRRVDVRATEIRSPRAEELGGLVGEVLVAAMSAGPAALPTHRKTMTRRRATKTASSSRWASVSWLSWMPETSEPASGVISLTVAERSRFVSGLVSGSLTREPGSSWRNGTRGSS